jgi:antitoxin component YwqK of YwqJK toxin-antitoxin module
MFPFIVFLCIGCREPMHISYTDPKISYSGTDILYDNGLFTGVLVSYFPQIEVFKFTPYQNGKIHGKETENSKDEKLVSERFYEDGKRIKNHRGWHKNGNLRFSYDYKDDKMDGDALEFYPSGNILSYNKMQNGMDMGGKKWREDGQVFLNYVNSENRSFGLRGGKLCNQVRSNENGNSTPY